MLQIGDKVCTERSQNIRTVTGIVAASTDPSLRLYSLNGGNSLWLESELISIDSRRGYTTATYDINDEVTIGNITYLVEGVSIKYRDNQPTYHYRLRPISGSEAYEFKYEDELAIHTNYTLF